MNGENGEEENSDAEEEEAKSEEDEELEETLIAAVRQPMRGDLEQLLASNLAAAVFAQPLDKVRMIFEGFMLLPPEEQLKIAKDEGEIQFIKDLYEVAVSLSNVVELEPPAPYIRGRFASVPWSFPTTVADRYLRPFINRIWWFAEGEEWQEFFRKVKSADPNTEEGQAVWNSYLRELARWLATGYAALSMVQQVKNEFIIRVMPYASQLLREIFKRYITKETWETMLSVVSGGKAKPKSGVQP
jgi:hypothetical protein